MATQLQPVHKNFHLILMEINQTKTLYQLISKKKFRTNPGS